MWFGIFGGVPVIAWYVSTGQTLVKSLRASPNSDWPSIFLGLAVLCIVGMFIANAVAHSRLDRLLTRQTANQGDTANPTQFRNIDEFYRTYDNVLLREVEGNVRGLANQYQPGSDRENFLVRTLSALTVLAGFEYTWWQIFGSQLRALQVLNTKPLSVASSGASWTVIPHPTPSRKNCSRSWSFVSPPCT
jgi:hypothetical protein